MFSPPSLLASDYYGPAIAASCFVLFMSRVAEPARRTFNAILVAGSCGAYLNRGFGPWELAYPLLATPVVYAGLRSYTFIGIAWLMHAARTWRTICGACSPRTTASKPATPQSGASSRQSSVPQRPAFRPRYGKPPRSEPPARENGDTTFRVLRPPV